MIAKAGETLGGQIGDGVRDGITVYLAAWCSWCCSLGLACHVCLKRVLLSTSFSWSTVYHVRLSVTTEEKGIPFFRMIRIFAHHPDLQKAHSCKAGWCLKHLAFICRVMKQGQLSENSMFFWLLAELPNLMLITCPRWAARTWEGSFLSALGNSSTSPFSLQQL